MGTNEDDLMAMESQLAPDPAVDSQVKSVMSSLSDAVETVDPSPDGWSIGIDLSKWLPTFGAPDPSHTFNESNLTKHADVVPEPLLPSPEPQDTVDRMPESLEEFVPMPKLAQSLSDGDWRRVSENDVFVPRTEMKWRLKIGELHNAISRRRSLFLSPTGSRHLEDTLQQVHRNAAQKTRLFLEKQRQRLLRELKFN